MENYNSDLETINNEVLILDNLNHIIWELKYGKPSMFRVAREAHLLLLRMMVEALRGTANLDIMKPKNRCNYYHYQRNNDPLKIIQKGSNPKGCKKAWRYTQPVTIEERELPSANTGDSGTGNNNDDWDDIVSFASRDLRGFYDMLAMIQAECFMEQYCDATPVHVTDEEMWLLEWLHEEIRNEYEHFMPKTYGVCCHTVTKATLTCLSISKKLLNESGNIISYEFSTFNNALEKALKLLHTTKALINNKRGSGNCQ